MTLSDKLFKPVDNSPLIVFRIIFGWLITLEAWGAILTGWVKSNFIEPAYHFPFMDVGWLQPLPGYGMYWYYGLMGLAGVGVMLGFYYRISISVYALMWTVVYLMQKTSYNNHYYLLVLLCFWMCVVPAHRYASLDVRRNPQLLRLTCPRWCLWIFALQVSIVYLYASLAKMYPDWLEARPISIWFNNKADYFLIGPLLAKPWFQQGIAYGGVAFDALIVFGLLWRKSRPYAFALSVFFHLFNSAVFLIGIFPYMGIALEMFFFNPEKIRRIFLKQKPVANLAEVSYSPQPWVSTGLALYVVLQLLLPLRPFFYPGNVHWTEEGHRLSWRMMLRTKSGTVQFTVRDAASGQTWQVNPTSYLTAKQARAVAVRPDMCWQFVQLLKQDYASRGYPEVEIYARSRVSLNGHSTRPLYCEDCDLASVPWHRFAHAAWLTPYEQAP